jgi:MoaA/NifB/PqqE/SkfB family radical SAM enzyme
MVTPSFPFLVEVEVTSACDLDCVYCFAKPFTNYTPSFEDLAYLLSKTKYEANPFELVLLGGEPFLRKDILDVMALTKNLFGHYGISTNGTMFRKFSREEFFRLKSLIDERTIQVSFDDVMPAINDRLRGGTKRTLEGLDLLEMHDVPFTVAMVVSKNNLGTLITSVAHLLRTYKCLRVINLMRLMPSESLGPRFYRLAATRDEYDAVGRKACGLPAILGRFDVIVQTERSNYEGKVMLDDVAAKPPGCLAGITRAEVFANGDVSPCLMLRRSRLGNLHKESWREIWQRSLSTYSSLKPSPDGRTLCEVANASGELVTISHGGLAC